MKHPLATPLRIIAIAAIAVVPMLAAIPKASAANDASITISPTSGSVVKGGSISFTINVNHGSNPVSSWKAFIKYSPSLFSGGSISAAGSSPFNLPIESSVSGGNISLVYGTINGSSAFNYSGALATVTLNTTAAGSASFGLEHNCAVAGDNECSAAYTTVVVNGNDTSVNVLGSTNTANFTITNPPAGGSGGSTGGSSTGGTTSGGSTSTNKGTTKSIAKATSGSPAAATTTAPATQTPATTTTETEKETSTDATVTLTLLDQNGKPVVGAKITVDGTTVTTDKNGKATLANVSPGAVSGKVTYKGKTQTINLNVEDGSSQPKQAAKVSINVKKSNAAAPIAITVGTLAVIAGAAFFIAGPGGGLGSLLSKLPGIGGGSGGPKPPTPGAAGPTPPPTTPTPPAPTPPQASATIQQPVNPQSTLPKHFDPTAPGTTFTPSQPTAIKIQ